MTDNNDEAAIKIEGLSKVFKLPHEKRSSIKSAFVNFFRRQTFERQKVLDDISFDIKKGEFFGIVGRNGSGKSTLLKILAGIYSPTKGDVKINGKLTPFIELGVGFNPELTGRENVFLNGALLGFNRKEMDIMYDEIVEFAELERFMDQKLKNYSSGMQVRLAFSIAIRAKSDILLIDEVLAVGDSIFQKKCYEYFKKLIKEKRSVVFVSHDTTALQEYCSKGVLLENGKIVFMGKINRVVNKYIEALNKEESNQDVLDDKKTNNSKNRIKSELGSGEIVIKKTQIRTLTSSSNKQIFSEEDEILEVEVVYKVQEDIDQPIYGFTIFDASGERIFVTNNLWTYEAVKVAKKGQSLRVRWQIPNVFNSGTFSITAAVAGFAGAQMFDQVEDAARFKIRKKSFSNAPINVKHDMKVEVI